MKTKIVNIFYVQHTEKISDTIFSKLVNSLPSKFQEEINAYKHWENQQASLLGKLVLQYAFEKVHLNYTLSDINIGKKDRLFLNTTIDFNISHSGNFVLVAIVEGANVGIDIEKHRPLDIQLFKKYFNEIEFNEIEKAENKLTAFFELWTIKESAIKCDGRGVEILSKTHKEYNLTHPINIVSIVENEQKKEFNYKQISIADNYACCVSCNKIFEIKIQEIQLDNLI